jgi:hypothetical protein
MESLTEFLARNHPPERNGSSPDQPNFVNLGKPADRSTLVRESAPGAHTVEDQHAMDYLVCGLLNLLPKTDSVWRLEERVKWLRLAADIFEVGYKAGDSALGEISIVAIKQVAVARAKAPQQSGEKSA